MHHTTWQEGLAKAAITSETTIVGGGGGQKTGAHAPHDTRYFTRQKNTTQNKTNAKRQWQANNTYKTFSKKEKTVADTNNSRLFLDA